MNAYLLTNEPAIRFSFFLGILLLMVLGERLAPRRPRSTPKGTRWIANLGMVAVDALALRLFLPATAISAAALAETRGLGFFPSLDLPGWLSVVLGVVLLDLAIYLQHVLFHALPSLWRLHMVHHSDLDFDTTTGVRFHPIEVLLSMGIKMAVVLLVGIPVLGVLIFEVLLNGTSLFNHGNVRLAARIDRILRLLVVTPEMHRVHHSVAIRETNSNFGFNLPWWDRLLGTYRAQPAAGHEGMTIGLSTFRDPRMLTLPGLLLLPLTGQPGKYPIGRNP